MSDMTFPVVSISLSTRLQRTDRFINSHPYSRIHRRSSSPPRPINVPSLISPSASSSSTLSSLATLSSASNPRPLRHSLSTLSSSSMSMSSTGDPVVGASQSLLPPVVPDPRVQRIRRSESFCAPSKDTATISGTRMRQSFKRAPSYGTLAQEARHSKIEEDTEINIPDPSSDEEEKVRNRQAKKPRMKSPTAGESPPPSSASSSPTVTAKSPSTARPSKPKPNLTVCTDGSKPSKKGKSAKGSLQASPSDMEEVVASAPAATTSRPRKSKARPMNLERNPSIFGAELPLPPSTASPVEPMTPVTLLPPPSAPPVIQSNGGIHDQQKSGGKTLRRVRRLPVRRMSFSSLLMSHVEGSGDGHDADAEGDDEEHEPRLGSAFQLR